MEITNPIARKRNTPATPECVIVASLVYGKYPITLVSNSGCSTYVP